jgi:CDP-archaeol synthase
MVLLVRVAWLILPVTMAGMAHVAVLKTGVLRALTVPIDSGKQWRGRPLLGSNKTWRGVLLMTGFTAGFTQLQSWIESRAHDGMPGVSRDYRTSAWLAGGVMGLSYCLAELPNSFVKRRLGIPPGARSARSSLLQYAVDQIDSVVGCLAALRLYYRPSRVESALAFVLGAAIHTGVDQLLYVLGVKRRHT